MTEDMQVERAPGGVLESVSQRREVAEIQAKMILAQRNPRNEKAALDRILTACARPGLAQTAAYEYSRGGAVITGASIRMAETMARCWGNLDYGIRELEQREGESTVEAYAWDMETNVSQRKIFQVSHIRSTKQGNKKLTDPRDIYELVANQGARRLRACILGVIPGDIVDSAMEACEATLKAKVAITPDLISGLVKAFAEFGVTQEQIEVRIQRHMDAITPGMVVQLRRIYTSLKDGVSRPTDWFGAINTPTTTDSDPAKASGKLNVGNLKPSEKKVKKTEPAVDAEIPVVDVSRDSVADPFEGGELFGGGK